MNAIVLAAGLSRRMGEKNKMLLPFKKTTILEHTLSEIVQASFTKIIVVTGNDKELITKNIGGYPVEIVFNPDFATGQVSSVKRGIGEITESEPFMVALGDMPLITAEMYRTIINQFLEYNSAKPTILRPISPKGKPGNPVFFDYSFQKKLLENTDYESSRSVIQSNKESLVLWSTSNPAFFTDIDTPEDYEKLICSGA